MRFSLAALMLVGLLSLAPPAYAQTLPDDDPLTVTLTPAYPQPYQSVTITVGSTLIDLASSVITMSAGGTVFSTGARSAAYTAGGAGSRTTISISAKTPDGTTYTKQIVIAPSDVALVIEPVSTAHALYKGAMLVAPEGRVRIVAVPDLRSSASARIPAQNLVYTWRLNDRILSDQSGIGRSVLIASAPPRYRDAAVSVTVTSQDQTAAGSASVEVAATSPFVRIYRHDPLLGINFNTALTGTYALAGEEDALRAVPYYFADTPLFAWSVGSVSGGTDPDITLRQTGAGSGSTLVSVATTLGTETSSTGLTVQFGQDIVNNLFGR